MDESAHIFNHAFPDNGKQGILLLREDHTSAANVTFLSDHAKELAHSGVTQAFVEIPYWFNPMLQAYQDGKMPRERLETYLNMGAQLNASQDVAKAELDKIDALNAVGIRTVAVDVRQSPPESSLMDDTGSILHANYQHYLKDYPQWAQQAQAIEGAKAQGIPTDVIMARLMRDHMGDEGHAVAICGYEHMNGTVRPAPWNPKEILSHGILDESLAAQGLKVTDMQVYKTVQAAQDASEGESLSWAGRQTQNLARFLGVTVQTTGDQRDFVYIADTGEVLNPQQMREQGILETNPLGEYPPAQEVYGGALVPNIPPGTLAPSSARGRE